MDVEPTLAEVARVLRPAGRLGIVWAGPDRRPPWVRRLLSRGRATNAIPEIVDTDQPSGPEDAGGAGGPDDAGGADRPGQGQDTGDSSAEGAGTAPGHRFFLPEHSAFAAPEFASIEWSRTMTLDDLVGLAGTFSRVITLPTEERERVIRRARTWLESQPELAQTGQVELPFRAACWRTNRTR
jgi:SAM-dependent methyltransferase